MRKLIRAYPKLPLLRRSRQTPRLHTSSSIRRAIISEPWELITRNKTCLVCIRFVFECFVCVVRFTLRDVHLNVHFERVSLERCLLSGSAHCAIDSPRRRLQRIVEAGSFRSLCSRRLTNIVRSVPKIMAVIATTVLWIFPVLTAVFSLGSFLVG